MAANADAGSREGGYFFPSIDVGMTWAEKYEVLTVPEDVLDSMSTEDLVTTVMRYPIKLDFSIADLPVRGLDVNVEHSNCLKELENRPDAGDELFRLYKSLNPGISAENADLKSLVEKDLDLGFVELMLSRDKVLESMSRTTKENLLQFCVAVYGERAFRYSDQQISFLAARLMREIGIRLPAGKSAAEIAEYLSFVEGQRRRRPEYEEIIREQMAIYNSR
jgi:hypothetical protein